MYLFINIILSLYAGFIIYNLSLAFLNIYNPIKQSILSVFSFAFLIFISKYVLLTPPIIHTVVLVILCTIFISLFHRVNIIISLISSLLTIIIIMLGSLLIICPLLNKFGFEITNSFKSLDWLFLNIGELSIPTFILVITKVKKIPLITFISNK